MTSDTDNVSAGVEKCRDMLESLKEFIEQVAKTGVEIREKAEQL